jgi:hypothetical protein
MGNLGLTHSSVLAVMDPKFEAMEMVCNMVEEAGDGARLASLDELANRAA